MSTSASTGGRFVGEGSYGCVFSPPPKCNEKKQNKTTSRGLIGKVFRHTDNAHDERKQQDIVHLIDPTGDFTIPLIGECTVSVFKDTDEVLKCRLISKAGIRDKYAQLVYKKGGQDLNDVAKSMANATDLRRKNAFVRMFFALRPIIAGVGKVHSAGYVHSDLKLDNMLWDDKTRKLTLIDFGLMTKVGDVFNKTNKELLLYPYLSYPPEFVLYGLSLQHKPRYPDFEKQFLKSLSHYLKMHKYIVVAKEELPHVFSDVRVATKGFVQRVANEFRQFTSKVDLYSLGISFLLLYDTMIQKETKATTTIKEFLLKIAHFNPYKRYSVEQALVEYDSIVNEIGKFSQKKQATKKN